VNPSRKADNLAGMLFAKSAASVCAVKMHGENS
jgi:hypothetical protein